MGLENGDKLNSGGLRDLRIHCGGFFARVTGAIDGDFKLVDGRFDKGYQGRRNGRRCGWRRYCRWSFLFSFTGGNSDQELEASITI
jgi:hypothetical protein